MLILKVTYYSCFKDVIDYLQGLSEEFFSRNNSHSTYHTARINHNKFFMLGQYSKRVISYQWQVLPGGQFQVSGFYPTREDNRCVSRQFSIDDDDVFLLEECRVWCVDCDGNENGVVFVSIMFGVSFLLLLSV